MLQSLEVNGFRGFGSLTVELSEITAIIGRNSSGKSSLLSAIRLATDSLDLALNSPDASFKVRPDRIDVCSKLVVVEPSRLTPLADWRQLFSEEIGPGRTKLRIVLRFEVTDVITELSVELVSGRNSQLLLDVWVKSDSTQTKAGAFGATSKNRANTARTELLRERPISVFIPAFYGVTSPEEYRSQPLVDRMLGSGDQSHIVRNLVARLNGNGFARLNSFLARTLQAELLKRTTHGEAQNIESLRVTFRDTNGELELSAAGTGLIAMVALYAAMDSIRGRRQGSTAPVVFLLDEPEAHLHPRLQGNVAQELVDLATEFGFQLVVATHSVEMINRFGRLRKARLLSVDRASNNIVQLNDQLGIVSALEDFADLEPFTALNMLASRRVLFCEGETDFPLLNACARVLYRSDDVRLREWNRYTQCELGGSGNAVTSSALRLALTPKLFPKLAQQPVRVGLVLDRDAFRSTKLDRSSQAGIEMVECVWSRYSIESVFLDAVVLANWLTEQLGVEESGLRVLIDAAIGKANKDDTLTDFAVDERTRFHRRMDLKTKTQVVESVAAKTARAEVRSSPEVFQRGKDRARKILNELRSTPEGKGLQGGLVKLVESADPNLLDPKVCVPTEIRELLEMLTAP